MDHNSAKNGRIQKKICASDLWRVKVHPGKFSDLNSQISDSGFLTIRTLTPGEQVRSLLPTAILAM